MRSDYLVDSIKKKYGMRWKQQVRILELADDFDIAIFFLQEVIRNNPTDVDAYIFMLFRLMDTIVEQACHFCNVSDTPVSDIKIRYYNAKEKHYEVLAKKYFKDGLAVFSNNHEFLYYVGLTAVMSPWYFDIDEADYESMIEKACVLDPGNPVYQWHFSELYSRPATDPEVIEYATMVLDSNSRFNQILNTKGACGDYLREMRQTWAQKIIKQTYNS